jgi:hypothetical protein
MIHMIDKMTTTGSRKLAISFLHLANPVCNFLWHRLQSLIANVKSQAEACAT